MIPHYAVGTREFQRTTQNSDKKCHEMAEHDLLIRF